MSARGSTPKTSSLSSMSPPALASRVCTLTFILAFLAFVGVGRGLRVVLGRLGFFIFFALGHLCGISLGSSLGLCLGGGAGLLLGRDRSDLGIARQRRNLVDRTFVDETCGSMLFLSGFRLLRLEQSGRIGSLFAARKLDRILNRQPAALVARNRALDEDKAARRIGANNLQILLGAVTSAHVPGHLLVLEDSARILAVTGRTV